MRFLTVLCGSGLFLALSTAAWTSGRDEVSNTVRPVEVPSLWVMEITEDDLTGATHLSEFIDEKLERAFGHLDKEYRGVGFYWLENASFCKPYPISKDGVLTNVDVPGYGFLDSCLDCMTDAGKNCWSDAEELADNFRGALRRVDLGDARVGWITETKAQANTEAAVAQAEAAAEAKIADAQDRADRVVRAAQEETDNVRAQLAAMIAESYQPSAVRVSADQVDVSELSLASAQASLAGPDSVYITNIEYAAQRYSALLKYRGGTTVTVERVYRTSGERLLDSVDLAHVRLVIAAPTVVDVSYVEVDGQGYSGYLRYVGDNRLESGGIQRVTLPPSAAEQIAALQTKLAATEAALAQAQEGAAAQAEAAAAAQAVAAEKIAAQGAELSRRQTVIDQLRREVGPGAEFSPERGREPTHSGGEHRP